MRVQLHNDPLVDALRPAWDELFEADPKATPFLSPGWGKAWLRHWASGLGFRPWVLTVHDADEVVGLAPLALRRHGPLRTLYPIGSYVGNYWDVLARPEYRATVEASVACELGRRRSAWDAIMLDTLPPTSTLRRHLIDVGLRVHPRGFRPYPGMALPQTFDEYLSGLSRKHRGDLRRHLRPLERKELQLVEVRDAQDIDRVVTALQRVRERWWHARGKTPNPDHSRPEFGAFLVTTLRELVPRHRAVIWELRRDSERVGVSVSLCDERTFYWWLSGFEPEAAGLGPGKIMIGESIRLSIAAGRTYYDFMVGDEAYKYFFGAEDREVPRLLVGSRRARSAAATRAVLVKDRLKGA